MIYRTLSNCIVTGGPATILRPFISNIYDPNYARFHTLCSGCDIKCTSVHSICCGVVIFIGTSEHLSVTIQYDATICITYAHLKSTSVVLGQPVETTATVGVADDYVRVEVLQSGPSKVWPVRIGATEYYKQDPETYVDGTTVLPDPTGESYASVVYPMTYNTDMLRPYIVTLWHNSDTPDWEGLIAMRVSGVTIEAGKLYNAFHMSQPKYINPKLPEWVESATKAGLAVGYMFIAQARNAVEAQAELYEFSFILRNWPATLGVWVVPSFGADISVNDQLLNVYKQGFDRLGLTGAIGLYVTRDQLRRCSWDTLQADWLLWLIDHTATVAEFESSVSPDFFRLGALND